MYLLIYAMAAQFKKLLINQSPFFRFILSPKRLLFLTIMFFVFTVFLAVNVSQNIYAATGINRTINFQGKVVNKDGTNIADGQYTFVFKLWDGPSGGANPWTETQNNVQVTAGIFRVSLGSVTTFASAGVDFNTDNLYLGINFNSDGEMTPRVRFAAVPYAINAEKVSGLTVTNTSGTLTIPNSKTVQFGGAFSTDANDISFTTSGSTTLALPTTGTLATLGGTENLSNKTFTTTITVSGVTTDLTTGTNEALIITPNGTGNVLINPSAGGQSALIVNKTGSGDIFAASASGVTKFVIQNDGTASSSAGFTIDGTGQLQTTRGQTLNLGGGSTGEISLQGGMGFKGSNVNTLRTISNAANDWNAGLYSKAIQTGGGGANTVDMGIIGQVDITSGTSNHGVGVFGYASGTSSTARTWIGTEGRAETNKAGDITYGVYGLSVLNTSDNTLTTAVGNIGSVQAGTAIGVKAINAIGLWGQIDTTGVGGEPGVYNFNGLFGNDITNYPTVFRGQINSGQANASLSISDTTDKFVLDLSNSIQGDSSKGVLSGFNIKFNDAAGTSSFNITTNGDVERFRIDSLGRLGLGTTSPLSALQVTRPLSFGTTGKALAIFDQIENQDILTASAGGITKFTINNNGTASSSAGFTVDGLGIIQSTRNQSLTVGGGSTGELTIGRTSQNTYLPGFANCTLKTTTGGLLNCGTDNTGSVGVFQETSGSIFANNSTEDLLFGGQSSTSAAFRITGQGNPFKGTLSAASVSASTSFAGFVVDNKGVGDLFTASSSGVTQLVLTNNGALGLGLGNGVSPTAKLDVNGAASISGLLAFRNGAGTIQTTANNTLTIGGNTTGNIIFAAGGNSSIFIKNNGDIGVGANNSSPLATFDIRPNFFNNGGTNAVASISGQTSKAALIVDNSGLGDIFTASSSGLNRFVIKQNGNVGIGISIPQAKLDIKDLISNAAYVQANMIAAGGDSTFVAGAGNWTVTGPPPWKVNIASSGVAAKDAPGVGIITLGNAFLNPTGAVAGNTYEVTFTFTTTASSSGSLTMSFGGTFDKAVGQGASMNTTETQVVVAANTNQLTFTPTMDWYGTIDTIIVRQVNISTVALRLEGSDGSTNPLEIRTGGDALKNVFIGNGSGRVNSTGNQNSAVGYQALYSNTTGANNAALGLQALYFNTTGGSNTAVGASALAANTSGSYNTANGAGALGANTTGTLNTAGGYQALFSNSTGGSNTANGAGALYTNTTGSNNTAVGLNALYTNSTGSFNTANGTSALYNNTTGTQNTALGVNALTANTIGSYNTSLGVNNLASNLNGSYNTALGLQTLYGNTSGSYNIGIGFNAGYSFTGTYGNQTGNNNLYIGYNAGPYTTNASFNNSAALGAFAFVNKSNALVLGGPANSAYAVNVGIGTATPSATLDIQGLTTAVASVSAITNGNGTGLVVGGDGSLQTVRNNTLTIGGNSTGNIQFKPNNSSTGLYLAADGSAAIGTITSLATLDVRSNLMDGGTHAIASFSGRTSFAGLVVDNTGLGDIFTASTGGVTKFTVKNNGQIYTSNYQNNGGILYTNSNGILAQTTIGNNGQCLQSVGGGAPTWGACGGAAGTWIIDSINGVHAPINNTLDLLIGGNSTQSAMFSVLGIAAGTNPSASVSATAGQNANKAIYMSGDGSLQSVRMNNLTVGGNTTGDIYLRPGNSAGMVRIVHGTTGAGGLILQDSEADSNLKVGRLSFANYSNSQPPTTGLIGVSDGNYNQLYLGGNSASANAQNLIRFFTAANQTTLIGTERLRIDQTGSLSVGTIQALGTAANATLDVKSVSGTLAVASVSGATSFSALVVDNSGVGPIFTASTGGVSKFTINNSGSITSSNYRVAGGIFFADGSGNFQQTSAGISGNCLVSTGGATPLFGSCLSGNNANWWTLQSVQGTLYPINATLDMLWGGTTTASASLRLSGSINQGTVSAASISANTAFAGLVLDNRGSGELLTASASGQTRFTIYNNGDVVIGNNPDSGFKLEVQGSVKIGNNLATDDITKDSTSDFTQSGYAITTNDSFDTVSTTGNQLKLVTDMIGAGATPTAPAAGQATGTNVTTGSVAFQRPDKKFVFFVGGAATSRIYDPTVDSWSPGPSTAGVVSLAAGARAFQRQNGSFLIMHGGVATTSIYQPGAANDFGTIIAGPNATGTVGAGSQIIRRTDGKVLVIHGNASSTTSVYDPVAAIGTISLIGTFMAGPATTATVTTGSVAFPGPDGKWLLMYGGASSQATAVYNPSATAGGASGGTFSTGPTWTAASATNAGGGAHAIQLPDGRYLIFLGGGSAVTVIYDWKSNSFAVGPSLAGGDTVNTGGHSFQRSDGKWVVVEGASATPNNLQLYDPTSGANGSFSQLTGANGLNGATGAGAGSTTIQKPDGTYLIIHGAGTGLTTAYDAGWNTTGTWTSEDITNTNISTYSAMMWRANPQSANNNARLDAETINFAVKTGDSPTSLANNPYRSLQDSGDLIHAYGNSQHAKIQISFTSPIRSYPSGINGYVSQTNIWGGEGNVFFRRSLIQPSVFSIRIQNPLVGYGDPSGQGDPAFGRNFATASALMEGVVADNSNRLTLATLRNFPTATASAGFIIASASANLGGNAGAGAHTIERNNGQFITILGNSLNTTRVYDADSGLWSAGPTLPANAGAGAHSFLLPDGRFFVVLGGTSNRTAIFDPQANVFLEGPRLFGNVGIGANTFQRSDGLFVILNGGVTTLTNILDPFNMAITQGPNTAGATPNVGAGAMNIKRPDGRILIILGNGNAIATGTNIYDPASNTFAAGPALVGGTVNTGGNAIQISTGRVLLFKSAATSNYLDPIQNTFLAGPTALANAAGSFLIPRSDGKILKATGATNTTSIIDPAANTVVTGTSAPTLPCSINTGAHVFQRQTGEYVVICGNGTAGTFIVDAGWNLGGSYTSEQIQVPNLSSTSSLFWKNAGQGSITVKYRTASTQQALGVAAWRDAPTSGSYISPNAGDEWLQVRFDLQGALQDLPGAKSRVWNGSDSGGGMVYYRQVQTPVLQYWKLMNIQDPTLLTLTSGGSNVFRFSSDGQAYTSDNGAWNSGGADLAERYQSKDTLQAGEVVSIDKIHPENTKRSSIPYDQNAMGVVSTQPGFVAGAYTADSYPIALVGRVPVKVSSENGVIHAGDYLTSASIPGYAMKATVGGRVLGQAMEPFDSAQGADCPKFGAGNLTTTQCGTITVFVNLTSYNGQSVDVAVKDNGFVLNEQNLPVIPGIDFSEGTTARQQQLTLQFLKTQADHGQSVYTDHIAATQDIISPQIITDLLVAKKIKAESIEGLDIITNSIERLTDQMATGSAVTGFSDRLTLLAQNQMDFQNQMASLSAKLDKMGAINLLSFAAKSTESSDLIMVNNFASFGTTTLSEVSVMNNMTIGSGTTLTLSQNSINTLGDDLNIQSMKQGAINFLGGLIKFDTDGTAKFAEDVSFQKNINVAGVMTARTVSSTELQLGQGETVVVSDTEVTATAAAGLVILKKGTDHVTIDNQLIKDSSFVFITPKTRSIQQLFLKDQVEGESFTVGVDSKADEDVKFNYLIVN